MRTLDGMPYADPRWDAICFRCSDERLQHCGCHVIAGNVHEDNQTTIAISASMNDQLPPEHNILNILTYCQDLLQGVCDTYIWKTRPNLIKLNLRPL